jgi:hypothetical protein
MSERSGGKDRAAAGMGMGQGVAEFVDGPYMLADVEVLRPSGEVERARIEHNVVCSGGLVYLINRAFGSVTNSTAGLNLFPHFATVGSGNAWANISGSQVSGYSANIPTVTFASNGANVSQSASAQYTFSHAGTQTVSGLGLNFYTANTMATSATGGLLYCYGTFSNGSRAVQSNDTLNATITISFGTL